MDSLLEKRSTSLSKYFQCLLKIKIITPSRVESLWAKLAPEKLASIYGLTASFEQDNEVIKSFDGIKGLIAFICNLYKGTQKVGEGRGARSSQKITAMILIRH